MKSIVMISVYLLTAIAYSAAQSTKSEEITDLHFYKNRSTWKEIEKYLPNEYRISPDTQPQEVFMNWKNWKIHLDFYKNEKSKAKIILLHGVGGNGRLLSFAAIPLFKEGFEIIAPDLPGYGLSIGKKKKVKYNDWIEFVSFLIDTEKEKDDRPIFVLGLSAGGMLAYQTAAQNPKVSGIIATNLLDQRNKKVRDASSGSKFKSRVGVPMLKLTAKVFGKMMLPMKAIANMKAIVNNEEVLEILLKDKTSSGNKVPLRFITGLVKAKPKVEPEHFKIPVLLVHPEIDNWTPLWTSQVFFDRLSGEKHLQMLGKAGHFPIEQPGIHQLPSFASAFIKQQLK